MTTFVAPTASTTAGAATGAIAWNVVLFSLFALHHSVCARTPVRRWVARLVPTPLERSTYIWIASLLLIAVCALWRPVPGVAWDVDGPWRWSLHLLQILGVWLTLRSAAILDVGEFAGITDTPGGPRPATEGASNRETGGAESAAVELSTRGPYAWVRHPIYVGWFLMVFAAAPMTMTRLTFALVSGLYVLIAIPFEERSMRASAGDAYRRYEAQVRWRLLPGLY